MQQADVSIHSFEEDSLLRLADLCATTYPGKEISDEKYLTWEYFSNVDGRALIKVAENETGLIAQYIVLPRKYSINNVLIDGSLSVNTLTHSSFRGNNLFPQLAEETFKRCREQKINFTLGFPNPVSLPVIQRKNLFETIGELSLTIKPLNPFGSLYKYLSGKREKTGKEIELDLTSIDGKNKEVSKLNLKEDKIVYDEFLSNFNREKQNVTLRSGEFLNWRYIAIPGRKYYLFKLMEEGSMTGLAVFRAKYIYGLRCGILIDFCSLKKASKLSEVLNKLQHISKINNLDMLLSATPSHTPEFSCLLENGYFKLPVKLLPQRLSVIIKKHLPDCPSQVTDFNKWFLTFGDYDIF
jgi:hypothetical protein